MARPRKETWAVVTPDGALVRELSPGSSVGGALNIAQRRAEQAEEGTTFYIEHRHVIGPSERTHRVDHVEGGIVYTTTLSNTN